MFARKLFTTSSASAYRAFGIQWSEHFKLTDVLELGRLGIRLRLGFIDQQLESGGSVMVRGGRGLLLLVNIDRVHKKDEAVDWWLQSDVVESRLHFRSHSLADQTHIHLDTFQFLLIRHCAELVQLRLHQCRQPRLDNVDGYVVILHGKTLDHRPHQTRPRARLDQTLVDRQIDNVLTIDRHQAVRRPDQDVPNCASGVRASLLKTCFGAAACIPSLRQWPPRTFCLCMR